MYRKTSYLLPLLLLLLIGEPISCAKSSPHGKPRQVLWSRNHIEAFLNDSLNINHPSFKYLISRADSYCGMAPLTVVNKPFLPSSGKVNDYMSLSTYAWPDTTKTDGLPYRVKDGYSNPEADKFDFPLLVEMSSRVQALTLAWYLTKKQEYAEKALEQVRVWFINQSTKMNPHMNYGQVVPGTNNGKGYDYGVLDGYYFVEMLDALILLEEYPGFSKREQNLVKKWFSKYLKWLTTSALGKSERNSRNNHGTSYDGQVLAFSIYTENHKKAEDVISGFGSKRIRKQIEADGSQPRELKRTRSFSYSIMNIDRTMDFLLMASFYGNPLPKEDVDLFLKSIEFILPYTGIKHEQWPYKQVINADYDKRLFLMDTYIISTYIAPYNEVLKGVEKPQDDRSRRNINNIIY